MSNPSNPPAFPRPLSKLSSEEVAIDHEGMTLRDWFAGQALIGFCQGGIVPCDEAKIAADVYKVADAMLKARES